MLLEKNLELLHDVIDVESTMELALENIDSYNAAIPFVKKGVTRAGLLGVVHLSILEALLAEINIHLKTLEFSHPKVFDTKILAADKYGLGCSMNISKLCKAARLTSTRTSDLKYKAKKKVLKNRMGKMLDASVEQAKKLYGEKKYRLKLADIRAENNKKGVVPNFIAELSFSETTLSLKLNPILTILSARYSSHYQAYKQKKEYLLSLNQKSELADNQTIFCPKKDLRQPFSPIGEFFNSPKEIIKKNGINYDERTAEAVEKGAEEIRGTQKTSFVYLDSQKNSKKEVGEGEPILYPSRPEGNFSAKGREDLESDDLLSAKGREDLESDDLLSAKGREDLESDDLLDFNLQKSGIGQILNQNSVFNFGSGQNDIQEAVDQSKRNARKFANTGKIHRKSKPLDQAAEALVLYCSQYQVLKVSKFRFDKRYQTALRVAKSFIIYVRKNETGGQSPYFDKEVLFVKDLIFKFFDNIKHLNETRTKKKFEYRYTVIEFLSTKKNEQGQYVMQTNCLRHFYEKLLPNYERRKKSVFLSSDCRIADQGLQDFVQSQVDNFHNDCGVQLEEYRRDGKKTLAGLHKIHMNTFMKIRLSIVSRLNENSRLTDKNKREVLAKFSKSTFELLRAKYLRQYIDFQITKAVSIQDGKLISLLSYWADVSEKVLDREGGQVFKKTQADMLQEGYDSLRKSLEQWKKTFRQQLDELKKSSTIYHKEVDDAKVYLIQQLDHIYSMYDYRKVE
ncbi:MAG: hypothetical protein AAF806_18895 [Bacteroidota bacterium]